MPRRALFPAFPGAALSALGKETSHSKLKKAGVDPGLSLFVPSPALDNHPKLRYPDRDKEGAV